MTVSKQPLFAAFLILLGLLYGGQAPAAPEAERVQAIRGVLTINNASQRFFEAGNDRFEAEIERLLQGDFAFSEDLLMIDKGVGIEDDWERLERWNDSLDEIDWID